jgi:hypothetical protein
LRAVDGSAVDAGEGTVLVFVHADCPTSTLALRRLASAGDGAARVVVVAQESPEAAARLARRTRTAAAVVADAPPYELTQAFAIESVPTAVVVGKERRIVGWQADAYEDLLGRRFEGEPRWKPGCESRTLEPAVRGALDEVEDMFERGWTDGLPVVPPTPERVEEMLGGREPQVSLGAVPPAHGEATLERVAACAVLAGCRPAYFPLVVAAVEAVLEPAFNAHGMAVTTQPAGVVVLVSGPARERVGIHSGIGVLGPGFRANLTIGRALRLVLTLTGGGRPGELDRATLASPLKIGLCFGEDEEGSPWAPFHAERGFAPEASVVTVIPADSPLSISDHRSRTPEELAHVLATAAGATWSPFWWPMNDVSLFVICPEHAALFAAAGWDRARVRQAIFDAAARPAGELKHGETTPLVWASADDAPVHKWTRPEKIMLVVAGGEAGRFSAVFAPADGMDNEPVSKEVRWST